MKKILCLVLLAFPLIGFTQTGSEIYLFDVALSKTGVSISNPVNITNRAGYDNQPSFHKKEPIVYYSSFNQEERSDIKTYNYKTTKTNSLTLTNEREYSPTLTPDGKYVSCIIQRDNGAQDLGKYSVDGGEAITIIEGLIVGYHSWVDKDNLILFVLGEPATLRWYDLENKKDHILAENVGRSLHGIPSEKAMSFVDKSSTDNWIINRLDSETQKSTAITSTIKGSEDMVWTPDGRIIMSDGEKLFFYNPKLKGDWTEVTINKGEVSLKGITRLAMSADGKKLAIVASE